MFSSHWPTHVQFAIKVLLFFVGIAAAFVAWRASYLWLIASKVEIEDVVPRTEISYEDSPALGILEAIVATNAVRAAYETSSAINARAARWTSGAAVISGILAVLSAV